MSWLLLDTSYLVYRAQYSIGEDGDARFGYLATVNQLRTRFDSDRFVHCFDGDNLKRKELLPTYKQRDADEKHEQLKAMAKRAMGSLARDILPKLGFKNLLVQSGYEADDIIASVIKRSIPAGEQVIIVSSDKDLLQLISKNVICYNPNKEQIINESRFTEQWGIAPTQWPFVKALAGCSSDKIPGIKGIGEKTAAKYLAGLLPSHTKAHLTINQARRSEINFRLALVELPFEGVNTFELHKDEDVNWRSVQTWTPGRTGT